MIDYDFSTLNDKEFELLVRDLLNAKFGMELQSFKSGRDKGIDLRFSTNKNKNELVVQAKHYSKSGFAQLKHTLIAMELSKVKLLKPNRYIVVTSLPLIASEKDIINDIMSPFILNANDIHGKDELNSYLSEFPEIEIRFYKLWFSSVSILNFILNNAIESRTRFLLQRINDKIKYYVATDNFNLATEKLIKNKLLLISGQPGIGKTTLAEILMFSCANKGFQIYSVENITEAEKVITLNEDVKQLFYFDDFLGSNYLEIINSQRTETQLTNFIKTIVSTPGKFLLLTTRTIILNQATYRYEKINHSEIQYNQIELKLKDYSDLDKAKILYNHLYFNEISSEYLNQILHDKFYNLIIKHANYTPRIIEFITAKNVIKNISPKNYQKFILDNLNNPERIWDYSFRNQIDYFDRCLLITLFTFESVQLDKDVLNAFEKRLEYERVQNNHVITTEQFENSIKILLKSFIQSQIVNTNNGYIRRYKFINPSIIDFLIGLVRNSFSERKNIVSSALYIEQLVRFTKKNSNLILNDELQIILKNRIDSEDIKVLNFIKDDLNYLPAYYAFTLVNLCSLINYDEVLLNKLKQLEFNQKWSGVSTILTSVLINLPKGTLSNDYVKNNFYKFINNLIINYEDLVAVEGLINLFNKYEEDLESFCDSDYGIDTILDLIERVTINERESNMGSDFQNSVVYLSEVEEKYLDSKEVFENLILMLLPNVYINRHDMFHLFDINELHWEEIIQKNRAYRAKIDDYDYRENMRMKHQPNPNESYESESDAIDELFD